MVTNQESELPLVLKFSGLQVSQIDALPAIFDQEIAKRRETLKQLEEERGSLLNYRVMMLCPRIRRICWPWPTLKFDAPDLRYWKFIRTAAVPVQAPDTKNFQLLTEHSERWEELSIGFMADTVPLLDALHDRLPSLSRVWIEWATPDSQKGVQSDFRNSVFSHSDCNEYRFVSIPIPAHQLTRYQPDGPWATHDNLLRMVPNVIEARVMIHFDQQPWPSPPDTIELMHLRRLCVELGMFRTTSEVRKLALWIEEDDYAHVPGCLETLFWSRNT
ncbi:hypothetical protein C8R47DRAFT_1082082 [Mycena vitilis]|nr:hypothetical protein C8R47DRAFT_1082082 [Mycena vitilis]